MEYKLKMENGRSCEIYCESDGKPLQDKINAAEERFGSQVKTINGKEVKEHSLGGFLVGAIIGGLAGNAVSKQGVKKTVKSVARKTTSTVKRVVDSVKKKPAPKSKRANYIPNRLIDSIETKSGKTIENKDIIDGAHTKSNVLVSRKRVDSQPKDIDKSKKLSLQTDYLSARKIKLINTTYGRKLKGSEILDGAYVKKGVFAHGGSIDTFNFKKFKLDELIAILPEDVQFMWMHVEGDENLKNYIRSYAPEYKSIKNIYWTITDFGKFELSKGSENMYLDIMVYKEDIKEPEIPYTISLYTKDNHLGLKNFASMLIQKFKKGGSVEFAKGGGVDLSTGEKLDLIAKRMYGKTYSQLMKTGRVTNGVKGFKRSEESEKVFKQYLKEYAIPGSQSSSYDDGGTADSKRYKVIIYHGGEQRDQVKYASTLDGARALSFQGEHSEIVDTKTNTLVYENGGKLKWADARKGDSARVVAENKMGMIVKDYGRKFHLKFPDGTEKTYDASELEFYKLGDDYDEYAKGGGVESGSTNIYKLRAEGLNDFLAFLQNGMYFRVKSFTIQPMGIPDVVVTFETDASLSEIKSKLREIPDSHVMLQTVKPINEYTGERTNKYAKGGSTDDDQKFLNFKNQLIKYSDFYDKGEGFNSRYVGLKNKLGDKSNGEYLIEGNEITWVYEDKKGNQYSSSEVPELIIDLTNTNYRLAKGGGVDSNREYLENRLWNERGYDYPYLNKLSFKELRSLYDTEFYYDETYAKGGMTEHGLRLGDKILKDAPYKLSEYILVEDKRENKHFVDLNRGERGKAFAKGGVIGQEITFNHWSGDVKRGTINEVHSTGEYIVQSGFGSMLVNPDDVISMNAPAPEKKFLGIFEDGGGVGNNDLVKIPISDMEDSDFQSLQEICESNDIACYIDESEMYLITDIEHLKKPFITDRDIALDIIKKYSVKKMSDGGDVMKSFPNGYPNLFAKGGGVDKYSYNVLNENTDQIYFKSPDKTYSSRKFEEFREMYPKEKISLYKLTAQKDGSSLYKRLRTTWPEDKKPNPNQKFNGPNIEKKILALRRKGFIVNKLRSEPNGSFYYKIQTKENKDNDAGTGIGYTIDDFGKDSFYHHSHGSNDQNTGNIWYWKGDGNGPRGWYTFDQDYIEDLIRKISASNKYESGGSVDFDRYDAMDPEIKKANDFKNGLVRYLQLNYITILNQEDANYDTDASIDLENGYHLSISSDFVMLSFVNDTDDEEAFYMKTIATYPADVSSYMKILDKLNSLNTSEFANGGTIDSNLLTAEENNMLKLILEHSIFAGYKEIQTFTSGGSNYHTMILLSNNHVVTINYESEDIQYSLDTYDSIDQYLDPEAFPGEEKGWDNEYYTPDSETRTANANLDNIPKFFDRMQNTFAGGGKINTKLLNEIDPNWVDLLHKVLKDPIFIDYQAISTFYDDYDGLFTAILLKNNHVVYIAWDGMQMTYSYKEYKSIAQFKKGEYDKEMEDYIGFEDVESGMPDYNKRWFSFYNSKSSEDIRNFFKQFEK